MINTILITIGLTLLASGLVIYFIWLGLMAWKLNSFKKVADQFLQELESRIEETNRVREEQDTMIYNRITEIDKELMNQININIDEVNSLINNNHEEINKRVDMCNTDQYDYINKEVAELNKKFDSRVDKLTEKMKSGNAIIINTPEELEKQLSSACDRILAKRE